MPDGRPLAPISDEQLAAVGLATGPITRDKEGRIVVSYELYQRLAEQGDRLDHFALQMAGPGGIGLVQATKFHKWFGLGYRPLGWVEPPPPPEPEPEPAAAPPTVFSCRETGPADCDRFFDSDAARVAHQRGAHRRG